MIVLRTLLGTELRRRRMAQKRTLLDVSSAARVSLGYLSEIERGRKEVSSECLAAICDALGASLAGVLNDVAVEVAALERGTVVALPTRTSDTAAA